MGTRVHSEKRSKLGRVPAGGYESIVHKGGSNVKHFFWGITKEGLASVVTARLRSHLAMSQAIFSQTKAAEWLTARDLLYQFASGKVENTFLYFFSLFFTFL